MSSFEVRRQQAQLARFREGQTERVQNPPVGLFVWADVAADDMPNWGTLVFPPLYCADNVEVNEAVAQIARHYHADITGWLKISTAARMTTLDTNPHIRIWVHCYRDARSNQT